MPAFRERLVLASRREDIDSAAQRVLGAMERLGYDKASAFAVRLALEEALVNAVHHGNRNDPRRSVTVNCDISDRQALFEVQDQGEGFDPRSVPDPTAAENLDIPSGRGLMLMRSFMAEVTIHPPGNRVSMRFAKP